MDGAHTRTLQRALEAIGSKEGLATVLQIQLPELESFLTGEKALPHQTFIDSFPSMCGRRKPADMRRYKEPVSRPQPSARYSCAALATPCSRSACGKKSV